jgi:uncharacterized RDD family membrane protein YckC
MSPNQPMRVRVAGFWRRAAAFLIDAVIIGACLQVVAVFIALIIGERLPAWREVGVDYVVELALSGGPMVSTALLCAGFVSLFYYLWFHALGGQTLGKRLLKIRVINQFGRPLGFACATMRLLGYFLSGIMLSLGFIWIAFDREKRGLHDWLAGTYVVRL